MDRKYLIAPTHRMGMFWAREMEIRNFKIISNLSQLRLEGTLKQSQVIFVYEEPFDYPEEVCNWKTAANFNNLMDAVERIIIYDI